MSYLDTSVLAACYCPEARIAAVQRVLSRLKAPTISPLVEVESSCAVARKVRAGRIDTSTAVRRVWTMRGTLVTFCGARSRMKRKWSMARRITSFVGDESGGYRRAVMLAETEERTSSPVAL